MTMSKTVIDDVAGLRQLAEAQRGLVSRPQLRALGVSGRAVARQVQYRRWREVTSVVVALHTGALTGSQRWWAAVLHAGPGSALTALTALEVVGLSGWHDRDLHVVVPRGTRIRTQRGIVQHESRRFSPERDVVHRQGLPCVTTARAAVDAASWSARPRTAGGLVMAVVQQRLATAEQVTAELHGAGAVRHRRLLATLLVAASDGAAAVSETDIVPILRRAGLTSIRRQAVRRDAAGRTRYLDLEVDLPDGTLLGIEIDGAVHLLPSTYWDDMRRQNDLVIGGDRVLRFSVMALHLMPDVVEAQLRAMRLAATPSRPATSQADRHHSQRRTA